MTNLDHWLEDKNGEPYPVDLNTWARGFESAGRIVKQEQVGRLWVSTVFLGLNHSWVGGPPILYESMIFPFYSWGESWMDRCGGNRKNALLMHREAIKEALSTESNWDSYFAWTDLTWLFVWMRESSIGRWASKLKRMWTFHKLDQWMKNRKQSRVT